MERMDVEEAATYIGASAYKVREMVREKKIPAYRIGSRIYFRKETIDRWIEQQEMENSKALYN